MRLLILLAMLAANVYAQTASSRPASAQPAANEKYSADDIEIARAYLEVERKLRLDEIKGLRIKNVEERKRKQTVRTSNLSEADKAVELSGIDKAIAENDARIAELEMQIKAKFAYDKPWEYSDDFKIGMLYIPPPVWPNPWKITRIIDGNQAIIHRFRVAGKGNGGASDTEMYWIVGLDTTEGTVGRSLSERQLAVWVMASGKRKVQPDDLKQIDSFRVIQLNTDCISELREAGK